MNSASQKILKQTMFESIVNRDLSKFKEIAKEVEKLTYNEMIAECSEKIKRTYR